MSLGSGQTATTRPGRRSVLAGLFFSPNERRLRAGWRLALQIILQLALTACVSLALIVGWRSMFTAGSSAISGQQIALTQMGELFAITVSIILARHFLDHRSFSSIGVKLGRRGLQDFAAGIGITLAMMGLIFLLELWLGWLHVNGFVWQIESTPRILQNVGMFMFICLAVGWNEELMSRGYHLQTLASGTNRVLGWFVSSLMFSVLHLANPRANAMAVAGIFLAGMFLGYGFIRSGQLWLSIGIHTGWNFFEGVVFGFPVSGLAFYRLTEASIDGPPVWTGGDFGPEAGLLLLPALATGFLLVHWYTQGYRTK